PGTSSCRASWRGSRRRRHSVAGRFRTTSPTWSSSSPPTQPASSRARRSAPTAGWPGPWTSTADRC
ncbi:MAG: hypothetical protein AVDCRST_MAG76-3522, partial [uncultured Acidimicrobiales bacterium]